MVEISLCAYVFTKVALQPLQRIPSNTSSTSPPHFFFTLSQFNLSIKRYRWKVSLILGKCGIKIHFASWLTQRISLTLERVLRRPPSSSVNEFAFFVFPQRKWRNREKRGGGLRNEMEKENRKNDKSVKIKCLFCLCSQQLQNFADWTTLKRPTPLEMRKYRVT